MVADILDLVKCFDGFSFLAQWAAFVNWVGLVPISSVSLLVVQVVERDSYKPSLFFFFFTPITINKVFIQKKKKNHNFA